MFADKIFESVLRQRLEAMQIDQRRKNIFFCQLLQRTQGLIDQHACSNDQQILASDKPIVNVEPVETQEGMKYWLVNKFSIQGDSGVKYLGGVGSQKTC